MVRTALERYTEEVIRRGHEPVGFLTAAEANQVYSNDKLGPGPVPADPDTTDPHESGTLVLHIEPGTQDELHRVTMEGHPYGDFLVREEVLRSMTDPDEVMDKLALKNAWGPYNSVSKVELDGAENNSIFVSTNGPVTDNSDSLDESVERSGGITQYYVIGYLNGWQEFELDDDDDRSMLKAYLDGDK